MVNPCKSSILLSAIVALTLMLVASGQTSNGQPSVDSAIRQAQMKKMAAAMLSKLKNWIKRATPFKRLATASSSATAAVNRGGNF
jgi:cytochrome c556